MRVLPFLPCFLLIVLGCLTPAAAQAHSIGAENAFYNGIWHPVLGLDHLLAMIAVGIISAQMGRGAVWSIPGAFVILMALGGIVGIYAIDSMDLPSGITLIEHGIIASVIVLGLVIALDKGIPFIMALVIVAFFGFFHGFAHGFEFPEEQTPWLYIAGFMIGTICLHIVGVTIGLSAKQLRKGPGLLRHMGSALLGIGIYMALEASNIY